jgi:putative nucleotidyltransferase with HDIG domain
LGDPALGVVFSVDSRVRRLPAVAQAYIGSVIVSAAIMAFLYTCAPDATFSRDPGGGPTLWLTVFLFVGAAFFLELHLIPIPATHLFDDSRNELALSSAVYMAALLLFGPAFAMLVGGIAILAADLWRRKPIYKGAFNAGQYVVAVGAAGLFLRDAAAGDYLLKGLVSTPKGMLTIAAVLVTYFLLNQILVGAIVALVDGTRLIDVLRHSFRQMLLEHVASLDIGLAGALLWMVAPLSIVLLALPIAVVYFSSRTTSQLRLETMRALVAVAEMVESRDPYSYRHSTEVARLAAQIATRMGLPLEEVEMVKLAGQLHDIGKMGTPDAVLNKPGGLTDDEWVRMRKHPLDGAKVLRYFSLFRTGVDLVLHHHEHYDGTGYPVGLAGPQIPIGARIIHVADAYQAMTSDRVYRKALDPGEAVRRLEASASSQFDPQVVKTLGDILRESGIVRGGETAPPNP